MNATTWKLRALLALACCTAGAGATTVSIDLSTGPAWAMRYNDVEAMVGRAGPAFAFDCLGSGAPQCLSVTSTGYDSGTWLPGASPAGFAGVWQTSIDFTLPVGATNAVLWFDMLGVDDMAQLSISTNGNGEFVTSAVNGEPLPAGTFDLQGMLGAPGVYRLAMDVFNGANVAIDGRAEPIGGGDGTAVAGRFRISYELQDQSVPEPGTLACAALALVATLRTRRRPSRPVGVSRSCAGLQ